MRLAELMLEVLAQIIALDPMGVWWGLRSASDGKSSGYPVHRLRRPPRRRPDRAQRPAR
jgi:hypothetical protein